MLLKRLPQRSTLFPYTTLFRSKRRRKMRRSRASGRSAPRRKVTARRPTRFGSPFDSSVARSRDREEHTSELQSHVNLVCRLLLEKKKNMRRRTEHNSSENHFIR